MISFGVSQKLSIGILTLTLVSEKIKKLNNICEKITYRYFYFLITKYGVHSQIQICPLTSLNGKI